jgi:hypothetical protein
MKTMMATLLALSGMIGCLAGESEVAPRTASAEPNTASTTNADTARTEQALAVPAAATSADQSCRSLMLRQRGCTAQFIPALVDARVKSDNPPGLAAREHEIGREALLRDALAEWQTDAQDPNIAAMCDDIAQAISPEKDSQLRSSVSSCLAEVGCEAFVSCAVPLNLIHWKS